MKTRILIDSVTYVSQVDVRQERNCDTNDISITVFPKFCMLSNLADLVELGTETTMAWLRRSLLRNSVNNSPTSSKILITISFVTEVHYMFDTCSRSTRPSSCTRLFKKMQQMSVRDLDKMKTLHKKKERGFQVHSLERNDDNLCQTGRSQTCRQTC